MYEYLNKNSTRCAGLQSPMHQTSKQRKISYAPGTRTLLELIGLVLFWLLLPGGLMTLDIQSTMLPSVFTCVRVPIDCRHHIPTYNTYDLLYVSTTANMKILISRSVPKIHQFVLLTQKCCCSLLLRPNCRSEAMHDQSMAQQEHLKPVY